MKASVSSIEDLPILDIFIRHIARFWPINIPEVQAANIDLLAFHGESAGDSILEELGTLEVFFAM